MFGCDGGASLIKSAKIRAFINEAREYNQAVYTFRAAKDKLPGDLTNTDKIGLHAGYTYAKGDFKAPYDGSNTVYGTPTLSSVGPFVELYLEGILDFEPKNTNNTSGHKYAHIALANNGAIPKSKYEKYIMIYYQYQNNTNTTSGSYNQGLVGNALTFNPGDKFIIDPKLLKNLDQKLDDGIFNSGKVRGYCEGSNKNKGLNSYDNAIQNNKNCAWFFIKLD